MSGSVGPAVDVDVAVVGAGFAGIVAARTVVESGCSCVLLEARDRVGGRAFSRSTARGGTVDLGPQFVSPGHSKLLSLIGEARCELRDVFESGDGIVMRRGVRSVGHLLDVDTEAKRALLEKLDGMAATVPAESPWSAPDAARLDGQTVESWIQQSTQDEDAAWLLRKIVESYIGSTRQLSLLSLLQYGAANGGFLSEHALFGQQRFLPGGMQALAEAISADLDLRLGAPLYALRVLGQTVRLTTAREEVVARNAIIAMPPQLALRIRYDPALPSRHDQLFQRAVSFASVKSIAVYDTPFWREQGLSGCFTSDQFPYPFTVDTSPSDDGPGILVVETTTSGPTGAPPLAELDPPARRKTVLATLASCFGPKALEPIDYADSWWGGEEYSRCCVGGFGPGTLTSWGQALREPAGLISFAGTEYSSSATQNVEGAIRSGAAVGEDVVSRL